MYCLGCQVKARKTVHSCDFERQDLCGWWVTPFTMPNGRMEWRRTRTPTPDLKTGPMWGHPKGSYYMYTFSRNAVPQSRGKVLDFHSNFILNDLRCIRVSIFLNACSFSFVFSLISLLHICNYYLQK